MPGTLGPRQRGFTLIELLIALTIIAVLTAVAVPMYRDFVLRSNRSDAVIALTELANLEEKHYSNELSYTTTLADLDYPSTSPNGFYSLSITDDASTDYILTATPISGEQQEEDDDCQQFTLNSFGQRSAEDGGGNDTTDECWNK